MFILKHAFMGSKVDNNYTAKNVGNFYLLKAIFIPERIIGSVDLIRRFSFNNSKSAVR